MFPQIVEALAHAGERVARRAVLLDEQALDAGVLGGGEDGGPVQNARAYFAGGYSTMRGFDFRGASPVKAPGIAVGGEFRFLGTVEYMFPLTADDMVKGVAFVDYGTVESELELNSENYRVAPGFGLQISPVTSTFAYPPFQDSPRNVPFPEGTLHPLGKEPTRLGCRRSCPGQGRMSSLRSALGSAKE